MKQELQQKLFDAAPLFFAQKDFSMRETCMCWGVECGDGWFELLLALVKEIEHYNTKGRFGPPPEHPVEAAQIKEKFGTLRVYTDYGCDYTDGLVRLAEAISEYTCEACGAVGKSRAGGWIRTLCDECHAKRHGR